MVVDWMPAALEPVVYRLARADACAYAIADHISAWSFGQPIELEQVGRDGAAYDVVIRRVKPVAPAVALLFSEAIHHLRAALDNVIWHLVAQAHGPLTARVARQVALPIHEDEEAYNRWIQQRVRDGLVAFSDTATLGQRVRSLQPFASTTESVPSIGVVLAAISGVDREFGHPLKLLQDYSNEDKHRQIRVAAARTIASTYDRPIWEQDRRQQPVTAGMVIASGVRGTPQIVETNTAAAIKRPGELEAWVNPVKEVSALRRYAADVAIPTLLTGLTLPKSIPPSIDLGDTGLEDRERIAAGGHEDAEARFAPRLAELFAASQEAQPTWLDSGEAGS